MEKGQWLQLGAGIFHLLQGGALTYLTFKQPDADERYQWPITRLGWEKVLEDKTTRVDIAKLLPYFSFLSSVNHLVSAAFYKSYYQNVLAVKQNWLRWTEYALSAGLMVFLIAILCGVTELRTLISLLMLNVVLQYMGLYIEYRKANQAETPELHALMAMAWGVFASMWIHLFISFYTVISDEDVKPPKIVYWIIGIMFTLFASFGVAQAAYVYGGIGFEKYEFALGSLSVISKSLLAWMVYGGIVAGNERFESE